MRMKQFLSPDRLIAACLAGLSILLLTLLAGGTARASFPEPFGNGTEDATVQIACARAADLPISFTANYDNQRRDLTYDHNTADCPLTNFRGELLRGNAGSGNLRSITFRGRDVVRNGETVTFDSQDPNDPTLTIRIRIRVYDYSGSLYIEITVSFF